MGGVNELFAIRGKHADLEVVILVLGLCTTWMFTVSLTCWQHCPHNKKSQEQNQHHQPPWQHKINNLWTLHLNYIKLPKFLVKDAYGL
jgi:hypothetical protein